VRDNGLGIGADMLPTIFELFVQDARTLGHSSGGLGIGLAVVRELVEAHGGTVECHSEGLDLGTEFTVRLPLP
jgi:signal transduction histidine kinase